LVPFRSGRPFAVALYVGALFAAVLGHAVTVGIHTVALGRGEGRAKA
jgi:hypothetical protein